MLGGLPGPGLQTVRKNARPRITQAAANVPDESTAAMRHTPEKSCDTHPVCCRKARNYGDSQTGQGARLGALSLTFGDQPIIRRQAGCAFAR